MRGTRLCVRDAPFPKEASQPETVEEQPEKPEKPEKPEQVPEKTGLSL